jgi:hypothetical protein
MLDDLKERLMQTMEIDSISIDKLYEELLIFFSESEDEFITRRHQELKDLGKSNPEIFSMIQGEIENRLFRGQPVSERKIKRVIYKEG